MFAADMVLVCALELLGRSRETFPLIRVLADRPSVVSAAAAAFVDRRDGSINLIAAAAPFKAALASLERRRSCSERPPFALIASILVHEEWHLRHGPDESDAYAAQLTTLSSLGLGPDTAHYHQVQKARSAVLARQAGRALAARLPP